MKNSDCYPGKKVGHLTLIKPVRIKLINNKEGRKWRPGWYCRCDCGNYCTVITYCLRKNSMCGQNCKLKKTQDGDGSSRGKYHTIYQRWNLMIKRCEDKSSPVYPYYGGRGIKVCREWHNYQTFKKWYLDQGFDIDNNDQRTTDRIDVNGNYEPSNCRLANYYEQANNKRNNHTILYRGKYLTPRQLHNIHPEISFNTLRSRIYKGLPIEKVLEKPKKRNIRVFGETLTVHEIADKYGVTISGINKWYTSGLSSMEIENKIKRYGKIFKKNGD